MGDDADAAGKRLIAGVVRTIHIPSAAVAHTCANLIGVSLSAKGPLRNSARLGHGCKRAFVIQAFSEGLSILAFANRDR